MPKLKTQQIVKGEDADGKTDAVAQWIWKYK